MYQVDKSIGPLVVEAKPTEPWRQVLLDAAQRLRDHGWCQGTWHQPSGEACATGALHFGFGAKPIKNASNMPSFEPNWPSVVERAADALEAAIDGNEVVTWNDRPGRTAEEVIAALEKAARS